MDGPMRQMEDRQSVRQSDGQINGCNGLLRWMDRWSK